MTGKYDKFNIFYLFCSVNVPCVLPADYLCFYDRRAPAAKNGAYTFSPAGHVRTVYRQKSMRVACASRTTSTKSVQRQPVEHVRPVARLALNVNCCIFFG